jgi:NAD(P)-dependent dehydrogenase (short-subunit alcohol dehydrogenase family)
MTRPVALVTGAARGLGQGAAVELARSGFDIVVVDLGTHADETLSAVREVGCGGVYVSGDIADTADTARIVGECWEAFGRVDSLVDNAGVAARPFTDVLELGEAAFDHLMDVNLRGTFFLTQQVAARMIAQPRLDAVTPSIIIITSIAAEIVGTDRTAYNLSKAGLAMLAATLAIRLGESGIAVYDVRPGFMHTDMSRSGRPAAIDAIIQSGAVPLRRWGTAEDLGRVVATLASGALPYTTGQIIWVDGGLHVPSAPKPPPHHAA